VLRTAACLDPTGVVFFLGHPQVPPEPGRVLRTAACLDPTGQGRGEAA